MSVFTVPSAREPVIYTDPSGKAAFSRVWFLFFQRLFERVGGATGDDDLIDSTDEGNAQLSASLYALEDEVHGAPFAGVPVMADPVMAELSAMRDELAELRKTVEGIQQGTAQ